MNNKQKAELTVTSAFATGAMAGVLTLVFYTHRWGVLLSVVLGAVITGISSYRGMTR